MTYADFRTELQRSTCWWLETRAGASPRCPGWSRRSRWEPGTRAPNRRRKSRPDQQQTKKSKKNVHLTLCRHPHPSCLIDPFYVKCFYQKLIIDVDDWTVVKTRRWQIGNSKLNAVPVKCFVWSQVLIHVRRAVLVIEKVLLFKTKRAIFLQCEKTWLNGSFFPLANNFCWSLRQILLSFESADLKHNETDL